jgi:hypothetical protein
MQLRSSTAKRRENKGNMCSGIQKQTHDIPESPLSPRNVEDTQVTPTKKQGKFPKMRGKMKEKQHSPEIFREDFIPVETLLKESPEAKKTRKGKGIKALGCPTSQTGKPELQTN